jgi:hypothetical protein
MKTMHLVAVAALAVLPFISSYAQAPAAPNLSPATAEVVRLAGAGTSEDVVLAYIQNSQTPFELSADHVLYLKDLGVPSPVVAAMLTRDSALHLQAPPPQAEAPPPAAAPMPMAAPAPAPGPGPQAGPPPAMAVSTPPADVGYFYNDLAPYGTWVDLPGAGWCWQPAVVSTTVGWQPYLHSGHWLNTDAGWFWSSDYSWGWAPFHYGRWQMHPTAGWVWFPGRVWGPSWVVWRSGGDNCGWAPLPPHADFVAGVGWSYNGVHVSANFDFGLSVGCFSFVGAAHFGDHNLHSYCLPRAQVTQVYKSTTIINNVTYVNNTYVNRGINVNVIEKAGGHKFETVKVSESHSGIAGVGGAYRHPLPAPAPLHNLTAVKMDTHGHVPAAWSSSKVSAASLGGSGNKFGAGNTGNAGVQKGNANLSNVKGAGATHDFSADKLDGKARAGTGVNANSKFTTTSGGNNNQSGGSGMQKGNANLSNAKVTGATHDFGTDNKANASSSLPANGKITGATGSGATGLSKAGAGGQGSNAKVYNYQGNQAKGQSDFNVQNKQLHSEDLRGANALTSHDTKFSNSSVSGSSQKNLSTSNSGNGGSGGNVNRSGSNPNLQRSGSSSAGGSKASNANKDVNGGGSSH